MKPIKTENTKHLVKTLYRFTNDYGANVIFHKETGYCEVIPVKYTGVNTMHVVDTHVSKLKDLTPEEMTTTLQMIEAIPGED